MGASSYNWGAADAGNFLLGKTPEVGTNLTRRCKYVDTTATTAVSIRQYKLMTIPAGAYVTRVQVYRITGENLVLNIGDTDATTTYVSANQSAATTMGTAWTTGKYYSAADEITMMWANASSNFTGFVIVDYGVVTTAGN